MAKNIKIEQAINVLLEEYKATRREVEQGITDFAKLGPLVSLAIGALLGLSTVPLITKLYLSLPLTCAAVLWTLALSRRANLWSEHIAIRQAFLEHRINVLAGYNLLIHENNVIESRKRRGLRGVHDFWQCFITYCVVQTVILSWGAYYATSLPASIDGKAADPKNLYEMLLLGTAIAPLLYFCYVDRLYRKQRRRLVESCENLRIPLGKLTHPLSPETVPVSNSRGWDFAGIEVENNLYNDQLRVDVRERWDVCSLSPAQAQPGSSGQTAE